MLLRRDAEDEVDGFGSGVHVLILVRDTCSGELCAAGGWRLGGGLSSARIGSLSGTRGPANGYLISIGSPGTTGSRSAHSRAPAPATRSQGAFLPPVRDKSASVAGGRDAIGRGRAASVRSRALPGPAAAGGCALERLRRTARRSADGGVELQPLRDLLGRGAGHCAIHPKTAASYGLDDPFDPAAAIDAQAHLMHDLIASSDRPSSLSPATTPAPPRSKPATASPGDYVLDTGLRIN